MEQQQRLRRFEKWRGEMELSIEELQRGLSKMQERESALAREVQKVSVRLEEKRSHVQAEQDRLQGHAAECEEAYSTAHFARDEAEVELKALKGEWDVVTRDLQSRKASILEQKTSIRRELQETEDRQETKRRSVRVHLQQLEREQSKVSGQRLRLEEASLRPLQEDLAQIDHAVAVASGATGSPISVEEGILADRLRQIQNGIGDLQQQHARLLDEDAALRAKLGRYSQEYTVEYEIACEQEEFSRSTGIDHSKEQELLAKRSAIDRDIEMMRESLRVRAVENERMKKEYEEAQRQHVHVLQRLAERRAVSQTFLAVRRDEQSRLRASCERIASEIEELAAKEKVRFEVLLKQEKLVEAEQRRYLEQWGREYEALRVRLADFTEDEGRRITVRENLAARKARNRIELVRNQERLALLRSRVSVLTNSSSAGGQNAGQLAMAVAELQACQKNVVELTEEARILAGGAGFGEVEMAELERGSAGDARSAADLDDLRIRRVMQERVLEREARVRLLDRWRLKAAQDNAALANQVAVNRQLLMNRLQEEQGRLDAVERQIAEIDGSALSPLSAMLENAHAGGGSALSSEEQGEDARWSARVALEKQRLDEFSQYVSSVEAQLATLLEQRRAAQSEYSVCADQNRRHEDAFRITSSSHDLRLRQLEAETLENYRKEHSKTFDSWRNAQGEFVAEQMIRRQLEQIADIFRKQVAERNGYFRKLLQRVSAELPPEIKAVVTKLEELGEIKSKEHDGRLADLRRAREEKSGKIVEELHKKREDILKRLSDVQADVSGLRAEEERLASETSKTSEEVARLEDVVVHSPSKHVAIEGTLNEELFSIEDSLRKAREHFGGRVSVAEQRLALVAKQMAESERLLKAASHRLREFRDLEAKRSLSDLDAERRSLVDRLAKLRERIDRRRIEIAQKQRDLDRATSTFEKEVVGQNIFLPAHDGAPVVGFGAPARTTTLKGELARLEQELASEHGWLAEHAAPGPGFAAGSAPSAAAMAGPSMAQLNHPSQRSRIAVAAEAEAWPGSGGGPHRPMQLQDHRGAGGDHDNDAFSDLSAPDADESAVPFLPGIHAAEIVDRKVFGPYEEPLSLEQLETLQLLLLRMLYGSKVARKAPSKAKTTAAAAAGSALIERLLSLSPDLSRIEIRDPNKKVAESYIRVDHIEKVVEKRPDGGPSAGAGSVLQLSIKDQPPVELRFTSAAVASDWIQGISILSRHVKHLFYLKYHIRQLLGEQVVEQIRLRGARRV